MIVLDASFIVKLVVEEEGSREAENLVEQWLQGGEKLATVDIALAESCNALWKHHAIHRDLGVEEFKAALEDLGRLWRLIHKYSTQELMHVAADIALRLGASFYDSLYLALALTRRAVLATFDRKLAGHAERLGVPVAP